MGSVACPRCPASFHPRQISSHLAETHLGRVSAELVCGSCDFAGQSLAHTVSHCLVEGHGLARIRNRGQWKIRELLHLASKSNSAEPSAFPSLDWPTIPPLFSQLPHTPPQQPSTKSTAKTKHINTTESSEVVDHEPELEAKADSIPFFSLRKGAESSPADTSWSPDTAPRLSDTVSTSPTAPSKEQPHGLWNEKWLELNGDVHSWNRLTRKAQDSQDAVPFAKNIPKNIATVVDILMEGEDWVGGKDYPTAAVTDESPSCLLVRSESSAAWLVRLNPASRMDLAFEKSGNGSSGSIWDCLPPSKVSRIRYHVATVSKDEDGRPYCLQAKMTEKKTAFSLQYMLIKREKMCLNSDIRRVVFHVEKMVEKGQKYISPFALVFATHLSNAEPSKWEMGERKALKMRPSLLAGLVAKVPNTLNSNKLGGGVEENIGTEEEVVDDCLPPTMPRTTKIDPALISNICL